MQMMQQQFSNCKVGRNAILKRSNILIKLVFFRISSEPFQKMHHSEPNSMQQSPSSKDASRSTAKNFPALS
jgi:hypothetical protein